MESGECLSLAWVIHNTKISPYYINANLREDILFILQNPLIKCLCNNHNIYCCSTGHYGQTDKLKNNDHLL